MDLPQGNCGLALWFVHIVHIAQLHSPLYNAFYFTNHWIIFPLLNIFTTPFQKEAFNWYKLVSLDAKKSYSQQCLVLIFAYVNAQFSHIENTHNHFNLGFLI
jgi:hypothetical protein